MNAGLSEDTVVARLASAIGEPGRARMLYCLMDGHARTSTELAIVAGVSPSTTSVHLHRLQSEALVKVFSQGKHKYYSLGGPHVGDVLESLSVLATGSASKFVPGTPSRLRAARTCYDHMAGTLGVSLHNRLKVLGWISNSSSGIDHEYDLTKNGAAALGNLGVDVAGTRALRRRFAYACLDWSERQPHMGGSLGAALLKLALRRRWVTQDLDSRALSLTKLGRRELLSRFGLAL
jgi:DNA-binding transcriptional ArsR family regulator